MNIITVHQQSMSAFTSSLLLPHASPITTNPSSVLSTSLTFLYRPTSLHSVSALPSPKPLQPWLAQLPEPPTTTNNGPPESGEGPIELPPSEPSVFAASDDASPLQAASGVLLTGAISVFLFRALRRRAKRAKELRFRSSGAKKTLKEEALDSLKAMAPASVEEKSPPSPVQAFLGGLAAGMIALVLYKFTTTVEAGLNRQTMSDNFSVRQITITIRTIINGLCYLATFVFGINSVGLILYSGQLTINSLMGGSAENDDDDEQSSFPNPVEKSSMQGTDLNNPAGNRNSDDTR